MEKITVVKIGGNVIDDPAVLKRFIADFAAMPGPKILVHGGGKVATRLAERLELKVQMVDGRRITDKGTLDVVTMVYAGLINKQAVAGLQAAGCNALGLSGADGNAVTARRRNPHPVDYGFVGDIERVDSELLRRLLMIEQEHGRKRMIHWGPRTLDLDLIYGKNITRDSEFLRLPHPFFWERAFVLVPLADIDPDFTFQGQPISERIEELHGLDCVRRTDERWEVTNHDGN